MATVGKTTIGAIDEGAGAGIVWGAKITMPEDGQITKITAYLLMWPNGTGAKMAIYDGATGAKLSESAPVVPSTSKAWIDFLESLPVTRKGQVLYLLLLSDATTYTSGDPSVVGGAQEVILYNQHYPTFPSTIAGFNLTHDNELSIYATYTPTVAPPQYQLTVQATAGGTTYPTPAVYGPYPAGSVETITAQASPSYVLVQWLLDGANAGSANPTNVTMNANHVLQAVFVALPPVNYTLTVNSTPIQGVPFTVEKVS